VESESPASEGPDAECGVDGSASEIRQLEQFFLGFMMNRRHGCHPTDPASLYQINLIFVKTEGKMNQKG
jgi:hypothetical protein